MSRKTAQGKGCILKKVYVVRPPKYGITRFTDVLNEGGISKLTTTLRKRGVESATTNKFIVDGLFMTITNANFDSSRFVSKIKEAYQLRENPSRRATSTGNPSILNLRLSDLEIGQSRGNGGQIERSRYSRHRKTRISAPYENLPHLWDKRYGCLREHATI